MPPFAYMRKSVVRQDDPGNSAEAQEAAVRALAARHEDGELVLLSDWDKSGRLGREKRPGYDALWRAIEAGTCSALYSVSMSRLARSTSELTRLFETCAAKGIPIRLEKDVIDTSTASGRMVAGILASVAAFEADVAGERLRSALAAKAARGERIGTAWFYGDRPGEDPAAVLAAFREAGSFAGAAGLLNARGIPARTSRWGWRPSSVAVVVRRLDPSAPMPRPAQRVAAGGGAGFLLSRLLACPYCGTFLTGGRDRRRGTTHYTCHMSQARPHTRTSISEHIILPAIQAEVARLRTPERVRTRAGDEKKRTELEARRLRVIDMYEAGIIERAERDRRLTAVTDALAALQERAVALDVPAVDWTWPPRELNAALRALFRSISLDPASFRPLPDGYEWTVPHWRA